MLLQAYLSKGGLSGNNLYHIDTLAAITPLVSSRFSAIFLDLYLPDSVGIDTFTHVARLFPTTPIIVLSGLSDAAVALQAIQCGAQEYLIKGEFNEKMLMKALSYSIERKHLQEIVRASNERYELLGKVTSEAIWELKTTTGVLYFWNIAYQSLFGYLPDNDCKWQWWYRKIHQADRRKVMQKFRTTIHAYKESLSFECRVRASTGSFKYILVKVYIEYYNQTIIRLIGSAQDIDELKTMHRELSRGRLNHRREIIKNTIDVQERERRSLGRELHDNINQILASCRMCVDAAIKSASLSAEVLPTVSQNLALALEEIRKISRNLVPPSLGSMSLSDAIRNLVFPLTIGNSLMFRIRISSFEMSEEIKLALYRIVQEQVHNILKYAGATVVMIKVNRTVREIRAEISDDGIGFDPNEKVEGIGLKNIRFRAECHNGKVSIESAPGHGCRIFITIPIT